MHNGHSWSTVCNRKLYILPVKEEALANGGLLCPKQTNKQIFQLFLLLQYPVIKACMKEQIFPPRSYVARFLYRPGRVIAMTSANTNYEL